jgi:hypothetical protein
LVGDTVQEFIGRAAVYSTQARRSRKVKKQL